MSEYFDVLNEWGEFTDEVASRKECHEKGLWHKACVVFVISEDNKRILLQQRSANKKLWPNLWDTTAGGHVLAGELGWKAVIREAKEELNLELTKNDLEFIGASSSENKEKDIINRHYNEFYVVHKDVDLADITLQEEEVRDARWFEKNELIRLIDNGLEGLAYKPSCWHYLKKYFEFLEK